MGDYIEIRSFDNYIEANIVLNMLRSANVSCHLKDENIVTIDPFLSPAIGGMKLMVHVNQVERAWDLMEDAEKKYIRSIPCPVCKEHLLEAVSIAHHPKNRLSALVSMFLNGRAIVEKKIYRCKGCGHDFRELPSPGEEF